MKKILLLFVLFLGMNGWAFAASDVQEFVQYDVYDSPTWVAYRDDPDDPDSPWTWYDDGCDKTTWIVGDVTILEESGPC
ncbi:MAG TPA: hypothetical protein ENK85_06880 [Saprospiraceae bacterium]|nr:hypothetical protein [Saprospiraceae bacterium]